MTLRLSDIHVQSLILRNLMQTEIIIASGSMLICFLASFYLIDTQSQYSLLYYSDSVSHLVIARRLFDSIIPGLTQLGGTWLPMTHIMLVPFVISDTLFHTGLAGNIISSFSTATTVVILFRIVRMHLKSQAAGLMSSALFMMNPSVIYMGIVPMMEAPFMMFFMLAVYYFQKWYFNYMNKGSFSQYRIMMKCAFAISAACLTRYEAWFLPIGLVFVMLFAFLSLPHKCDKNRIRRFFTIVTIFSLLGIILWILWNTVVFRDPLFFANGPYSAAIQAASRPFSMHLHMHPLTSLVIILNVASAMYGIPVLIISLGGIITFLYANRNSGTLSFSLLTVGMLLTPILTDYIAMIEGSGEIYPVGNNEWFNGRYLIFVAPFLAFGSTSIIFFTDKTIRARRSGTTASNLLSAAMIAIIIISYSMIFVTQPFVVGKTIAMADTSLLPFQKGNQFTSETGKIMGNLYYGGVGGGKKILLLTPNQVGQQIMFASNLPIRTFIDVEAGHYWSTSIVSPWSYGDYLVLEKPIHTLAYEKTTYDPALKIISYWQSNEGVLLKYYRNTYENQYFEILIRK